MIWLSIISLLVVLVDSRVLEGNETTSMLTENLVIKHRQKFTIEELLNSNFPHSISGDLDLDICKAGTLYFP